MYAMKDDHFHMIANYQLLSSIMLSSCYLCVFCEENELYFSL